MSAFRRVTGVLVSTDMFGGKFEMIIKSQSTYKTLLGAFLTMLTVAAIVAYAYGQFKIVADDTSPAVRDYVEFNAESSYLDVEDSGIPPILIAFNMTSGRPMTRFLTNTFVTIEADLLGARRDLNLGVDIPTKTRLPSKHCKSLLNPKPYK